MKKNYLFIPAICLLAACGQSSENTTEPVGEIPAEETSLLVGEWNMDSSVFIDGGVYGVVSAPLAPTTWIFSEDGSYNVKNTITMNGTYQSTNDSLFVVLLSVPNNYEILRLDDEQLHLRSTIIETDSMSMKTEAYLTRVSN